MTLGVKRNSFVFLLPFYWTGSSVSVPRPLAWVRGRVLHTTIGGKIDYEDTPESVVKQPILI